MTTSRKGEKRRVGVMAAFALALAFRLDLTSASTDTLRSEVLTCATLLFQDLRESICCLCREVPAKLGDFCRLDVPFKALPLDETFRDDGFFLLFMVD